MYFLDPQNSLDHNQDSLNFYRDWGNPSWKGAPIFSLFSWDPQIWGQNKRKLRAEGFTPKSVRLGQKSGMSHREIKSNTYVTSTHFSCFLQNQSSYKTVIIEILQLAIVCHPPVDIVAMQICKRKSGISSLNSGSQTYPSFSGHNPRVWLWIE